MGPGHDVTWATSVSEVPTENGQEAEQPLLRPPARAVSAPSERRALHGLRVTPPMAGALATCSPALDPLTQRGGLVAVSLTWKRQPLDPPAFENTHA